MPATGIGSKWVGGDLVFYDKASGTEVLRLNGSGQFVYIDAIKQIPTQLVECVLPGALAATASNHGPFFIAPLALQLTAAAELHTTAGADGGTVTLTVEKLTGTQAPGGGVAMLTGTFNLKGAMNTVQTLTPSATQANTQMAVGDRMSLLLTGTPTAVAGVVVQVSLKAI